MNYLNGLPLNNIDIITKKEDKGRFTDIYAFFAAVCLTKKGVNLKKKSAFRHSRLWDLHTTQSGIPSWGALLVQRLEHHRL